MQNDGIGHRFSAAYFKLDRTHTEMPMSIETKTCRTCRSEIDQRARVCPHCRYPQGAWAFARYGLIATFLLVAVALTWWSKRSLMAVVDPPKYSAYLGSLKVTKSEVVYDKTGARPVITTFGTIENQSDVPWKDLYIQVRYFDATGHMVDAQAEEAYRSFVPPHGEGVFRFQMQASRGRDDYRKHEVIIHHARYGGNAW